MDDAPASLIRDGGLDVEALRQLCARPAPFAPGERLFWDDEHISEQLLAAHLDPRTDAASRAPTTIARTVQWLLQYLGLRAADRVLDLGCGPGLYCAHFAEAGLAVTGIDYSRRSIAYARARAAERGLPIQYIQGDYLDVPFPRDLRAVFMIYGDLCVLADDRRDALLRKIHAALGTDGHFMFDVTTRRHRGRVGARNGWSVAGAGFWRAAPHLVLTQGFDYPDRDLYLDQFIVVDEDGALRVYRNWFHDYALDTITPVLAAQRFAVQDTWSDLAGTPYDPAAEWIGIAARPCP
jgi:SAM-dependent methyltransferase